MGLGARRLGFRVAAENPSRAWTRQRVMKVETTASGKQIALRLFILEADARPRNIFSRVRVSLLQRERE